MTEGLESEAHEGGRNNGITSNALSSQTLELLVNNAGNLEVDSSQSHAHTAEEALFQVCCVHADEEISLDVCRICQCHDADEVGETALKSLNITVPSHAVHRNSKACVQTGLMRHVDRLMELGCECKNDLALAHYACALRWFVSRASEVCEICGKPAANIRFVDWNMVLCFLKGKDALRQSHVMPVVASGENNPPSADQCIVQAFPYASENLVEILAWFDPAGNTTTLPRTFSEHVINVPNEGSSSTSPGTRLVVEVTGILIATGLLTVTITWLLSSRVNESVARRGVNLLLGGLCALSIVVFLRFGVLPRIKYGPARYWAILVVFWFLVFGVWASTTRSARSHS